MPRDHRVAKLAKASYSLLLYYSLLFTIILRFHKKIDFYFSGAIKVVLAQIQICFKLNSSEKLHTVLFLDLDNEYFQPLTATYLR